MMRIETRENKIMEVKYEREILTLSASTRNLKSVPPPETLVDESRSYANDCNGDGIRFPNGQECPETTILSARVASPGGNGGNFIKLSARYN